MRPWPASSQHSTEVDLALLRRHFDLRRFGGLVQPPSEDGSLGGDEAGSGGFSGPGAGAAEEASPGGTARLAVLGPDLGAARGMAEELALRYGGLVVVDPREVADAIAAREAKRQAEAEASGEKGDPERTQAAARAAEACAAGVTGPAGDGQAVDLSGVPPELLTPLLAERLSSPDASVQGFVLVGYPVTREQAQSLAQASCLPSAFVATYSSAALEAAAGGGGEGEESKGDAPSPGPISADLTAFLATVGGSAQGGGAPSGGEEAKEGGGEGGSVGRGVLVLPPVVVDFGARSGAANSVLAATEALEASSSALAELARVANESPAERDAREEATLRHLPANAFAVTLFCMDGPAECRACDFLPHAFRTFPDRDYCVLTVPTMVDGLCPRFCLLDFF